MEWFALSSNYWMDPKFIGISATAERLFTRLLGYCRMVNSGGYVCQHGERNVGITRPKGAMNELIARQIIIPTDDGGHYFPAWDRWQQYGDDLQEQKKKDRDRKRTRRAEDKKVSADKPGLSGGTLHNTTLHNTTSTKESVPAAPKPPAKSTKGTRLSADWTPPADEVVKMQDRYPQLNLDAILDKFRDYWISVAGARGVKLDWTATWRNWIRSDAERNNTPAIHQSKPTGVGAASTKAQGWLDLANQFSTTDDQRMIE